MRRNKVEEPPKRQEEKKERKERSWYTVGRSGDGDNKDRVKGKPKPHCLYCGKEHWGESCDVVGILAKRREFFMMKKLCFNCGRPGHREKECRSRGCFKCKARHHTSLCDQHSAVFTGYIPTNEERLLPAIVPLKMQE